MSPKNPKPSAHTSAAHTTKAVDAFMDKLDHPCKAEIEAIRSTILGAHATVAEGVKWNAPSFRTTEYFATTHLRQPAGVGVILHLGAKVRDLGAEGLSMPDPDHLLKWLAKDRAIVVFKDMHDFQAKRLAFEGLLRQWLRHV